MRDEHQQFTLKPFEHIAGCSLGTWSDRDSALACLDTIRAACDSPTASHADLSIDLLSHYRELAEDADDCIDLDYYADLVDRYLSEYLPSSCAFSWDDGEFRVTPYVDDCLPRYSELPETEQDADGDELYLVNDHGNVGHYTWDYNTREWSLIWSMV